MTEEQTNRLCDSFMRRMRIEGDDGSEREIILEYMQSGMDYLSGIACGGDVDFVTDTRQRNCYTTMFFIPAANVLRNLKKITGLCSAPSAVRHG